MDEPFLRRLFADKHVVDDREPVWTLAVPSWRSHVIAGAAAIETRTWALYAPRLELWQQMTYLLILQVVFQCSVAVINYYCIVQPRRRRRRVTENQHKKKTDDDDTTPSDTITSSMIPAYLLGWGILVPLAVYLPYGVLSYLDIHSRVTKMAAATSAFVVGFRTVEAMYDTSPHSVEATLSNYVAYYSTLMHFDWDYRTATRRKITTRELIREVGLVVFFGLALSMVLSWELYYKFLPFSSPMEDLAGFQFRPDLWLSPGHLANCYVLAVLVYLTLSFGFRLTALGVQLQGYRTQPIFDNPLWGSRRPSEFWGRKWNLTIHQLLKHGAFLPARHICGSTQTAVLVTFVVSGLIHDYAWTLTFHQDSHNDFVPRFLKLTAFFAWNGVVMLLERSPVGTFLGTLTRKWPTVLVSTLVVGTALPVSHWYSGDWVEGGYFDDLSMGTWLLRPLASK